MVCSHDVMFNYLRERISDVHEIYVPRGDHMLAGCEEEVIEKIIQWASATEYCNASG